MSEEKPLLKKQAVSLKVWVAGIAAGVFGSVLAILLSVSGKPLIHGYWFLGLILPVAVFFSVILWRSRGIHESEKADCPLEYSQIVAWSLLAAVIFHLFSGSVYDPWFYFLRWMPGADSGYLPILKYGIVRFCVFTAILIPVLMCCKSKVSMWVIISGMLIWAQILCFNRLWHVTGGRPLYGDAHPAFIYRLWIYAQSFPRLIYYDPFWNAGTESSSLVSSGIIPLGTFLLPFWKFCQVDLIYTPVLALAFMVIVPALAGFSIRIAGGGWIAAGVASMLALGTSQYFFFWLLVNGAVGACFALPFILPVSACLYRVLWLDGFENSTGIILVLSLVMFLAWPPSVSMAVVFLLALLVSLKQWSTRKLMFLLLCVISAAVVCLPFVVDVLGHVDPLDPLQADMTNFSWQGGWLRLAGYFRQANPCIVFFGVLGVWFLPQKGVRAVFGVIIAFLAVLAGWGDLLNPHLHLSRAAVPLFFVSIIPAALWMGKWLENPAARMIFVRASILSLLLLCGLGSARLYGNKGPVQYVVMNNDVDQFTAWIDKNTVEGERILFAGPTKHEYGNGRIAILPFLTGREMMAADYFHVPASSGEWDYPVVPARGKEKEVFDFMNLYNVDYVVTCHDNWRVFLREGPEKYEEIKSFDQRVEKTVFRVKHKPDQFVRGSGRVKAGINELVVGLDNPMEEAVIRYNWQDGMTAEAPVEIRPFNMGRDVRFIAVVPHGKSTFRIIYRKLL